MSELLTAAELGAKLRLKANTIHTWARSGKIPHVKLTPKVVRFDADAVAAALRKRAKAIA